MNPLWFALLVLGASAFGGLLLAERRGLLDELRGSAWLPWLLVAALLVVLVLRITSRDWIGVAVVGVLVVLLGVSAAVRHSTR